MFPINVPKTHTVSTNKVKAIRIPDDPNKGVVKGADWFPVAYPNIWLCASKNSGKTTTQSNIIMRVKGPETKFLFIVSTYNKDPIWIKLINKLRNDGHEVECYHDIVDEDGLNVLEELYNALKEQDDEKENEQEIKIRQLEAEKAKIIATVTKPPRILIQPIITQPTTSVTKEVEKIEKAIEKVQDEKAKDEKKEKKPKAITPDWIIVSDDQGKDNRNRWVAQILKKNRHWHIMYITSTQDAKDVTPDAIRQMDYTLLFPGISEERLYDIWENLRPSIDYDKFSALYKDATSVKYRFLYVSKDNDYRKGFTEQYNL